VFVKGWEEPAHPPASAAAVLAAPREAGATETEGLVQMADSMTSRDRMMAALDCRAPDYTPCCFSAFQSLEHRCRSAREFVERQVEMGLDVAVRVPSLPVRHDPRVTTREWRDDEGDGPYPILHKEYATPAGLLQVTVAKSDDWPHGDHVPFFDDFLIPRCSKFLITRDDNLRALQYLLAPPTEEQENELAAGARAAHALAQERDLLTVAHYGMVGDVACWLAGMSDLTLMARDDPGFVKSFLDLIQEWNSRRMAVVLREGVDLFIRRAWYENADVWSPPMFEEFILPGLEADVDEAHRAGAKFGYLMSCSSMPLIDMIVDAGVDVLLGIDPAQDRMMDLALLKVKTAGRMALWGGVCGYLTVECGTEEDVRREVREAMATLAPGGGFILAPVTNVRSDSDRARANVAALVDEWKCSSDADRVRARGTDG
jgi:uroporphyrinogen-III decarboxylase